MHCMPSKAIRALFLFIGISVGTAAFAQTSGLLASEQAPALAEHPYTPLAAQAANLAVNETSEASDVPASEQGLENLHSERERALLADARAVPQALQKPQPLASDTPAEAPGQ